MTGGSRMAEGSDRLICDVHRLELISSLTSAVSAATADQLIRLLRAQTGTRAKLLLLDSSSLILEGSWSPSDSPPAFKVLKHQPKPRGCVYAGEPEINVSITTGVHGDPPIPPKAGALQPSI